MKQPPAALLSRACQIFMKLAYPGGEATVPASKRTYLHIDPDQPLDSLLGPPVCQVLPAASGGVRGHAFRLGRAGYPNLKMQVIDCDNQETWVLAVDTHDGIPLNPGDPDAPRWTEIQAANRRLKEQIERAWESEGLLTFNGLLRRELSSR